MVNDLTDGDSGCLEVGDVVLTKADRHGARGLPLRAVGGGEDLGVGDETPATEGDGGEGGDQPHLPGVLVGRRGLASHYLVFTSRPLTTLTARLG